MDASARSKSWIILAEIAMNLNRLFSTTASLIVLALGAHAASQQPGTPAGGLTIEQLIDVRHPSNPIWSPDGRSVVFVWERAGVSKVYVAGASSAAADGAAPRSPRELREAGSTLAGAFWATDGRALMMARNGDLWRVP